MDPGVAPNTLPSRLRFSWVVKSPPWTDGKENQEKYKNAVLDWKKFHDYLPDSSFNKVSVAVQGIVLKSQLYGEAADFCSALSIDQLKQVDGLQLIIDTVYQRDFLSVISEAYEGFNRLLNTRRENNELLKSFEIRFSVSVAKFNSMLETTKLHQCITALMILRNAAIEHSQRDACLNDAAPNGRVFSDQSSNDELMSAVTYKQLASVVRQCEKAPSTSSTSTYNTLNSSSAAGFVKKHKIVKFWPPSNSTLKKNSCHQCSKYGHWKESYNDDGSLKKGATSFEPTNEFVSFIDGTSDAQGKNHSSKKKTVIFNMATLSSFASGFSSDINSVVYIKGLLVDDGAPYSATGQIELKLLLDHLGSDLSKMLDPIPDILNGYTHWQYGIGKHASAPRKFFGSTSLKTYTNSGLEVNIRHLVLNGLSQWIVGKNVTR